MAPFLFGLDIFKSIDIFEVFVIMGILFNLKRSNPMPKIITQEAFIAKAISKFGNKYTYELTKYVAAKSPIIVTCPIHGPFSIQANNFINNNQGCAKCAGRGVDWVERFKSVHGDTYDYSKVKYVDYKKKVIIVCKKHGEYQQTPDNHYRGKQGCPLCGNIRVRLSKQLDFNEFVRRAKLLHGEKFSFSCDNWENMLHSQIAITCEHGVNKQTAVNFLAGKIGCQKCGNMKSSLEEEIKDFLAIHTIAISRNRNIIPPKEIDIWLPKYDIGVEFHGLYWHTTTKIGFAHREKWEMAQKAGIRLIQIFEDEWLEKQDIVKARLLAFLGKAEKRDARKLTIKALEWSEAKTFLHKTHIQGSGPSGAAYGLYDADLLVAVATFGKSRSGAMTGAKTEGEYEVLRYASIGVVRGGFTKLLTKFIKNYSPTRLISYCDLRYGTGNLYEKAGFKLECVTPPDYWWVPKGQIRRIPRYATQKHKLANSSHEFHKFYAPDKTERQICEEAGLEKIHGVGSQKWVWKPSFL